MVWRLSGIALLVALMATQSSVREPAEGSAVVRADTIPPRAARAVNGTGFAEMTRGWAARKRQAAAVHELLNGNVPQFLRQFRPIHLEHVDAEGHRITATVWVMPDYLAIGSDADFLHIPLTLPSATRLANAWGCVLPTRKIVDAVHAQADRLLEPIPMAPGPKMRSSDYYLRHQRLIDAQRGTVPPGTIVSGHKKDLVLTRRLAAKADRVAIYGWHRVNGQPIQPLSTVHGVRYADYSHGVRLVWGQVMIEGRWRSIYDVLRDPRLAPVLSHEGAFRAPRKLMHTRGEPWEDVTAPAGAP